MKVNEILGKVKGDQTVDLFCKSITQQSGRDQNDLF